MTTSEQSSSGWESALFSSDDFLENPHPYYHLLRQSNSVYWHEPYQSWVVTSYSDVKKGLQDSRFSAERLQSFFELAAPEVRQKLAPLESFYNTWLMFTDPPMHDRLKQSVQKSFSPANVAALQTETVRFTQHLLTQLPATAEVDLLHDFATPLSIQVLSLLMGLNPENYSEIAELSSQLTSFLGSGVPNDEVGTKALLSLDQLKTFLKNEMTEKRANPGDDILSGLVTAGNLREEEIFAISANLIVDGHEPVANTICNTLFTLLNTPEKLRILHKDPVLLTAAIEEGLRLEPTFTYSARRATENLTLGSQQIYSDQVVMFMLIAANRDPSIFAEPDTIDFSRAKNQQLSFGYGAHFCLGAALGKAITLNALQPLLQQHPGMQLVPDSSHWKKMVGFRALDQLRVSLSAASF